MIIYDNSDNSNNNNNSNNDNNNNSDNDNNSAFFVLHCFGAQPEALRLGLFCFHQPRTQTQMDGLRPGCLRSEAQWSAVAGDPQAGDPLNQLGYVGVKEHPVVQSFSPPFFLATPTIF
jgi:hypothetical protein